MFIFTGKFQGRTVSLKWDNGVLFGDQAALKKAEYENTLDHGYLGPIPADTNINYLAEELPARGLLRRYVFDSIITEKNDDEPLNPNAIY